MRWALLALLLSFMTAAKACLNDRDTLAAEVERKPDVLWVIVGWFERNPPLYYTMRIQRVESELKKNRCQPDLYDDIGVANERIGNHAAAIAWMGRKRAVSMGSKATQAHDWYRYYANLGTFFAHDWISKRKRVKGTSELEKAADCISKAIELNPQAHFLREGYQLAAIEWILDRETGQTNKALADSDEFERQLIANRKLAPDGIAGLIRLGGAWESPDVYDALAASLTLGRPSRIADIALARRDELIKQGIKPIGPISESKVGDQDDADEYVRLKAAADEWRKNRTDFMMSRLKQGRHPDTDPDFWAGYVELPKPRIVDYFWQRLPKDSLYLIGFALLASIAVTWKIVYDIRARSRRRLSAV